MKNILHILSVFIVLLFSQNANAIISIDITQGNVEPLPIALPYLGSDNPEAVALGEKIINVVEKDLISSGLFRSITRRAFIQKINGSATVPEFPSWTGINASALATGGINLIANNEFEMEFRLWDTHAQQQIAGKSYSTNRNNWRRIAHLMADEIYSRLTGESGYFDTRIVYVSESGPAIKRVKRLAIMDQDGANHRYLTDGSELVLTPRFSPTAQKVIYMTYSNSVPKVYILDVDTKEREVVGNFSGMSFAPRFAPDGKSVILSSSVGGNSEIFTMDLRTKIQKRLTNNGAIDTSPSFSPDGKSIVFNSDRGGSQQLYIMDKNGNNVRRISFGQGRYGTPVWSPRGDLIAFTKMYKGSFFIGVMRTDGSGERLLTESYLDEGPTWSPNGRVIMFARQEKNRGDKDGEWQIYSVDLTGYNQRLIKTPMDGSDPAWSPLL
ncbi:MAG: Tol-Pal system beta propeller repeat protein TolB [Alphaproteobacteria bacterium CG11_big_fil_rev_8_21_14_0_20_39_49]|nr:MAG: Tol-Pal system beta propeller repeat protein TolB [Alphaproteobacteria bacterium CG11_big_fil_rev_8_21_14_0_20_39_49]